MRWVEPLLAVAVIAAGLTRHSGPYQNPGKASLCPAIDLTRAASAPRKCGIRCGSDRWRVKTFSDPDRLQVSMVPVSTTVESLAALPRPKFRPQYQRVPPTETTIFCVEGWLADFPRTQLDGDMHVVIAGLQDTSVTMIVEIPDRRCYGACGSGFAQRYAEAYDALMSRLETWNTDTLRVRVMGVGFFDGDHGQVGNAPNVIELHPVLGIDFP